MFKRGVMADCYYRSVWNTVRPMWSFGVSTILYLNWLDCPGLHRASVLTRAPVQLVLLTVSQFF